MTLYHGEKDSAPTENPPTLVFTQHKQEKSTGSVFMIYLQIAAF